MKAVVQDRYGSEEVLSLRGIASPEVGDKEVLVSVRAAGVDPGVWHVMAGLPYLIRVVGFGFRRPKVAVRGLDLAGTVVAIGSGVTRFAVGDEVFGIGVGSFAELACAPDSKLALKPKNLSFEEAAAVPVSALTALQGLRDKGQLKAGQTVLINGAAGGVGRRSRCTRARVGHSTPRSRSRCTTSPTRSPSRAGARRRRPPTGRRSHARKRRSDRGAMRSRRR